MKIHLGADHAGYEMKEKLKLYLGDLDYEVEDKGAFELATEDDYPDFVKQVAKAVSADEESRGIIIGGSGQGEAMCANRTKGARAAVFYGAVVAKDKVDIEGRESSDPYEIVKLSRLHNDANILSLSARFLSEDEAKHVVKIFLETEFSGDERHIRRISKY